MRHKGAHKSETEESSETCSSHTRQSVLLGLARDPRCVIGGLQADQVMCIVQAPAGVNKGVEPEMPVTWCTHKIAV